MSQQVDADITRLLDGMGLDGQEHDMCDFTVEDQNLVLESQALSPSAPSDFRPILKVNVCYIVACVIINERDEVLMMQEAKPSCAGKWYLPAGKIERGETIEQAAVREVLEETGLQCELTTLLVVETLNGNWFRFTFTARVVGGELKTKADKESLQAKWISNYREISLRDDDIVHLIEKAQSHKLSKLSGTWHSDVLPASIPHEKDLLRLIIINKGTNKLHVLISQKPAVHFPTCEIYPDDNLQYTIENYMEQIFGVDKGLKTTLELLNLEHNPVSDGCCFSLLVQVSTPCLDKVSINQKYVWWQLSHDVESKFLSVINTNNSKIHLVFE